MMQEKTEMEVLQTTRQSLIAEIVGMIDGLRDTPEAKNLKEAFSRYAFVSDNLVHKSWVSGLNFGKANVWTSKAR